MMNPLIFLLPTLLMVHNMVDFTQNGAPDAYVNILNCVVTDYIEILEDHNDLKLVNKSALLDQRIHRLGLQFEVYNHYSLDHARTMMIGLVDSFLDALNQSKRLIPFRPNPCGFSSNDIEIRVTFIDDCKFPYPAFDEIKYMSFAHGIITYNVGNPRCLGQLLRYREEPLGFARRASPPPAQFIPPKCRPL